MNPICFQIHDPEIVNTPEKKHATYNKHTYVNNSVTAVVPSAGEFEA